MLNQHFQQSASGKIHLQHDKSVVPTMANKEVLDNMIFMINFCLRDLTNIIIDDSNSENVVNRQLMRAMKSKHSNENSHDSNSAMRE